MNNVNRSVTNLKLIFLSLVGGLMAIASLTYAPQVRAAVSCDATNTVTADVVAMDQSVMFNRLGAQNVNYMMYALKRDVVNIDSGLPLVSVGGATAGEAIAGRVGLRPDKRPRPLVLRVAAGDCLKVNLTNLLTPTDNPFNALFDDNSKLNDNNCKDADGIPLPNYSDCKKLMNIEEEITDPRFSQNCINDQDHRRWNQNAQSAATGQGSSGKVTRVTITFHFR